MDVIFIVKAIADCDKKYSKTVEFNNRKKPA